MEERVDPAPPWTGAVGDRRELELERLPVRVEDDMVAGAIHRAHRERDAVRGVRPVRFAEFDAVPGDLCLAEQLVERDARRLVLDVSQYPSCVEQAHEPMNISLFR